MKTSESQFKQLINNIFTSGIHESSPPDMVILDMIMPGMGGGETYDRMREIHPTIKVLLSSGYSINGQAKEIIKRGCDGFIQKPFTLGEVSKAIREVLGEKKK